MTSFWNLILEPGKKYEKTVENGIHVSQAALDTSKATPGDDMVQVLLEYEGRDMVVANLSMKKGIFQSALDLAFSAGDCIAFTATGSKIPVTLTGVAGEVGEDSEDEDEFEDSMEDSLDMDDSDEPSLVPAGTKRKMNGYALASGKDKKMKLAATLNGDSFMSDDESDDDNYNPMMDPDLTKDEAEVCEPEEEDEDEESESGEEVEEEEEDEDELDEEEEEYEESDDEEAQEAIQAALAKLTQRNMNGLSSKKAEASTPKLTKVEKMKSATKDSSPAKTSNTPSKTSNTPSKSNVLTKTSNTPAKEGKHVANKKENKTTNKDGAAKSPKAAVTQVAAVGESPNSNKTPKKDKKKKNKTKEGKVDTPVGKKMETASKSPKALAGGLLVEDLAVGKGQKASKGNTVSVYYEGRLQGSNKTFDKAVSGPPFKFRLGAGEVIRGWDVGVEGMCVGGKRKLTVPAHMGYGKRGSLPQIPPNAVLDFTVTLIKC